MTKILTILIADDNEVQVEQLYKRLKDNERYKIIGIARNTEEEIKLIKELKPQLVITDIKKNDLWDGIDVIRRFNTKEYCPTFFVVSASISEYLNEIIKLKIKYTLNKPYYFEDLLKRLDEAYADLYLKDKDISLK